jgi:phospholipid/cholesterol/gamma-HCH transport system permease protein
MGAMAFDAVLKPINRLGRSAAQALAELGYVGLLLVESVWFTLVGWRRGQPVRVRAVFEQMRQVGVDAIPIVTLLAFTVGVMLGIQFIAALGEFGAESEVVIAVAKSVTREFGALITGIVVAGRSGSAFAARIGSMNVSQEIDALAVIGIEPVRYLAAPALLAMIVMMPTLTMLANVASLLGAALYCSPIIDVSVSAYLVQTLDTLDPRDLWEGLSKSVVFAVLITLVGVSTGFGVSGGAEGVGRATTRAVVLSISALVIADMLFSFFLNR